MYRAPWQFLRQIIIWTVVTVALWPYHASGKANDELKAGVVQVFGEAKEQSAKVGSGVIVWLEPHTAYILTASHVVAGYEVSVAFFKKPSYRFVAKVYQMEGGEDDGLAVLLVRGDLPPTLPILCIDSTVQVSGGEPVSIIGFPQEGDGTPWAVTTGSIHGLKNRSIELQAPILEGNSGGPVLLGERIVGVVATSRGQFGGAIPAETVRRVLKSWRVPFCDKPSPSVLPILKGKWTNAANPTLSYVFDQEDNAVTVIEISQSDEGRILTARGTGRLEGKKLTLSLDTAFGDKIQSEMAIADDGSSMSGSFTNTKSRQTGQIILWRAPN